MITHLITKAWIQVCSEPKYLERYFTKLGCGMSTTGEYDHLVLHISSPPVIIHLSMMLVKIVLSVLYIPLQIVKIHRRIIFQMRM